MLIISEQEMFNILTGFGYGELIHDKHDIYSKEKLIKIACDTYHFEVFTGHIDNKIYFSGGTFESVPPVGSNLLSDYHLLNMRMQDDYTPTGGIAHNDERFAEFVEETLQENYEGMMDRFNAMLKECGIKPIDPSKL